MLILLVSTAFQKKSNKMTISLCAAKEEPLCKFHEKSYKYQLGRF